MASQLDIGGKAYTRLPGRASGLFSLFTRDTQRLYLGDDHLFVATTSYFYERYKRFYFADIQSLTLQKSAAGAVFNVVLGAIAGLFATFAVAGYFDQWNLAAQIILLVIAGLFGVFTLINTAFGPTCQCHILTAVHEEPLHCLGRLFTAQRVTEYLRAVIEGVQGSAGDMTDGTAHAAQRVDRAADRRAMVSVQHAESGRVHATLFVALLVDALLGLFVIFYRDTFPQGLSLASTVLIMALVFTAAIRQRNSDVPGSVRTPVWIALVFNMAMLAITMYISIFLEVLSQSPEVDAVKAIQDGFVSIGNAVNFVINTATGMFGLYNLRIWRRVVAARAEQQRVAADAGGTP